VAVKLLRPEVASSQMLLRRFNAEAEAVAKLSHPNTVNIYDFGQDFDGTLFIAMEFIEGRSLRSVVQQDAPLPLRRAFHIATQIAASLSDAHAHAIIHRDLKPDNVMLQDRGRQRDVVRVLDFGIAKLRDEDRRSQLAMTQAGDMLGTPQYMAPEQIRAETIDGRTDIYALGCMLYEMVTGRLPFEAPTVMALLSKHLLETCVPPSQRRPDLMLPPAVDQLILTAMAKDPRVRPATMEAFGEQIAELAASLPVDTQQQTAQHSSAGRVESSAALAMPASGGYPPTAAGVVATAAPTGPGTVAPRRSQAGLWVVVALLVAGAGVGLYVALARNPQPSGPDPWAGGSAATGSQGLPGSAVAATETPDAAPAPDASAAAVDPWSSSGGTTTGEPDPPAEPDDPPARPVKPTTPTTGGWPAECAAYTRAIERFAKCDKLPAGMRKQLVDAARMAKAGFSAMPPTPENRAHMASTCKQGMDAMAQAMKSVGCS
jgi:serine/threonine-protein kinase